MPAYPDAIAIAQAVLQANLPSAAVGQDDLTYNLLSAVAAVIDQGYTEIQTTQTQMNPQTATGPFLDDLANSVGVFRNPAFFSAGTVVVTMTPGPVSNQTIPAGTVVSTTGAPGVFFLTGADSTIPPPGTAGNPSSSPAIPVTAAVGGANGNVNAGTIQIINFQVNPGTLTVTNAAGTTGGSDGESDSGLRARTLAATEVKYGAADLTAAVVAVPGVYDAWINDPSAPALTDTNPSGSSTSTGLYNCYWCASDGTQPGGTATAVLNALVATEPTGVIPTLSAFTVVTITAVSVNYRVPVGVSPTIVEPLIKNAVVAYIQTLVHNQIPDAFNMGLYVQFAVGGILTLFTLNSTSPSIGSAAHNTIYRCIASPSAVVTTVPV